LMVMETVSVVAGKVEPLPIVPESVMELVPAVIDCDGVRFVNADVKTPCPLSGALCVELAKPLLAVMVTNAVRVPAAVGLKLIWRLQLASDTIVAQGVDKLKSPGFGPVSKTLVSDTVVVPGFVMVIVCVEPVPTVCAAKIRFGGVNVSVVACE